MSEPVLNPLATQTVRDELWFGSATGALMGALQAIGCEGGWVAVPPNICPNVLAAVYGAGSLPWFVDIEQERQGMDPDRLAEVLDQGKAGVCAVIAVHAYGTPCRITEIAELCRDAGVPLIEDCAQADGAIHEGREVGEFGEFAVFSFGTGKIVEAGGGGLARVLPGWSAGMHAVADTWPVEADGIVGEDLGYVYRLFYNRFYPERTALAQEAMLALLRQLAPAMCTRCAPNRVAHLAARRTRRAALAAERRRKYALYTDMLAGSDGIAAVPLVDGSAPWRFNAMVEPSRRDSLFRRLLAESRKASTWYPRASLFLPAASYRASGLKVAERYERGLLNLWLDDATGDDDIRTLCLRLRSEA